MIKFYCWTSFSKVDKASSALPMDPRAYAISQASDMKKRFTRQSNIIIINPTVQFYVIKLKYSLVGVDQVRKKIDESDFHINIWKINKICWSTHSKEWPGECWVATPMQQHQERPLGAPLVHSEHIPALKRHIFARVPVLPPWHGGVISPPTHCKPTRTTPPPCWPVTQRNISVPSEWDQYKSVGMDCRFFWGVDCLKTPKQHPYSYFPSNWASELPSFLKCCEWPWL